MTDLLNQIPPTVYVALFTASFTAIATLTGVYLTNRGHKQRLEIQLKHESEIKNKSFQMEKLEELYFLFNESVDSFRTTFNNYTKAMSGYISLEELFDIQIEIGNKSDLRFSRILVLVSLYFPDLKHAFEEVNSARLDVLKVYKVYKDCCEKGDRNGERFLQIANETMQICSIESEKLLQLIAEKSSL